MFLYMTNKYLEFEFGFWTASKNVKSHDACIFNLFGSEAV